MQGTDSSYVADKNMKNNNRKTKRLLFIHLYGGGGIVGGTEIYLKNLLKEMKQQTPEISVYLAVLNKKNNIFPSLAEKIEDNRFTRFLESWTAVRWQYRYRVLGFLSYLWGVLWLYVTARRMAINEKVDAVYANGGHLSSLVAYLLHRELSLRYAVHFHGVFNFSGFFFPGLTRRILCSATPVIANSKDVATDVKKLLSEDTYCPIVHCFVDQSVFYPQDRQTCRKKLGLPEDAFIILSGNRLDIGKKIPLLLQSVTGLENDVRCVIIGDGPYRGEVEERIRRDPRFIYLPIVANEKLPLYINAADIVWGVCSVYYISLTLIEALACGVPVIASRKPSPIDMNWGQKVAPETIPKSVGFLVDENVSDITKLFRRMKQNRSVLQRMSGDCVRFYDRVYGKKNIKQIMEIIRTLTL